jgi:hypothetical protein
MTTHVVKTGENLSSIARKYGYSNWRTIIDDPTNAEFKRTHQNPNLIFPGERIVIPDKPAADSSPEASFAPVDDDDFESTEYSINYRSEKGNLSKYLKVKYSNGLVKDINIDTITTSQPNLTHAKEEALKVMDQYNSLFILQVFPIVFQILTMGTSIDPAVEMPTVSRPVVPRRTFSTPSRAPGILESKGAVRPGTQTRLHTDPFTGETSPIMATAKTDRSLITSIRADVAESEAYKSALYVQKEIGIQRPTGANISGADFITARLRPGTRKVVEVIANDVKASVQGKFPVPKTTVPGSWRTEIQNAIAPNRLDLGDTALEAEIRLAVQQGRVRLRQLNVNYSMQGQGSIVGW